MRKLIKKTFKSVFKILLYPIYLWFSLLALMFNEDRVFASFSQALSLIPGKIGTYCRAAFYSLACPETSDEIVVGFLTIFSHRDTTIERGVYIGPQCNIGKCYIRKNTLVGSGVHVLSGNKQHNISDLTKPIKNQGGTFKKIDICENCWIGNCAILYVDVPTNCVVAAGAIVTQLFNEGDVIAGSPGRVLKNRNLSCSSERKNGQT